MRILSTRAVLFATTGALVLPLAAQAQDASPDAVNGSDIVVTARRTEERLQDVPISITVLSQQQISNRDIVTGADLSTYTPSLSSNSRFGADNASFAIRGFTQDSGTAPSVGVYFADVVAPRSSSGTPTGNGAGPGAFFDLQNVQVLKGPQGTLFGRNTTGGAILLVPQKPTSRFEGYVEGSIGNFDMRRVQAVVNVPLNDTFKVRLGLDRQVRDGYLQNKSGIGPRDFADIDYWAGRVSVVADLTPTLENYLIGTFSQSNTNGFLPHIVDCRRSGATGAAALSAPFACAQIDRQAARGDSIYDVENPIVDPYQNIQQWQLINTTTWIASDTITIKNIVSYGQFKEAFRSAVYGDNLILTTGPNAGRSFAFSISSPYPGRKTAEQESFTEELQLQGRAFGDALTYQAGVYTEQSNPLGFSGSLSASASVCPTTSAFDCRPVAAGISSISSRSAAARFRDYAAYAQATYKVTSTVSGTLGIRYTYDRSDVRARQISIGTLPVTSFPAVGTCSNILVFGTAAQGNRGKTEDQCEVRLRQTSKKPTWLADIDYKPTDDILLYAKYARGYRQGGVFPYAAGLEAFRPEQVDTYEVGVKTSLRGAIRGTFNVAAFYNDFSNQQLAIGANPNLLGQPADPANNIPAGQNPSAAGIQFVANAGKSRIAGVEVDASISPFAGFTVDGGYTYLDTKLKSLTFPAPSALYRSYTTSNIAGGPLTLSPKNKYTITATYVLPIDEAIGRVSVGATFTHSDSQQNSFGSRPFVAAIGFDPGLIGAQNLLNLNLRWTDIFGKPVDLSVFVTNLTKDKTPLAGITGYSSFGYDAISPAPPRIYGARMRVRF